MLVGIAGMKLIAVATFWILGLSSILAVLAGFAKWSYDITRGIEISRYFLG